MSDRDSINQTAGSAVRIDDRRGRSTERPDDQGGECTRCGCPESVVINTRRWWGGKTIERRRCDHCGAVFSSTRAES